MFLIYDKSRITLQSLAIAQNYYYLKQEKSRKVTTFFLYHQIFFKKNAKLSAFFMFYNIYLTRLYIYLLYTL